MWQRVREKGDDGRSDPTECPHRCPVQPEPQGVLSGTTAAHLSPADAPTVATVSAFAGHLHYGHLIDLGIGITGHHQSIGVLFPAIPPGTRILTHPAVCGSSQIGRIGPSRIIERAERGEEIITGWALTDGRGRGWR
ncbi:hypothetical protein GCM10027280_52920 [Micromonospora polyrhachis]